MESTGPESGPRYLAEASKALASSFDLALTLSRVASLTSRTLAAACIIEIAADEAQRRVVAMAIRRPRDVDETRLKSTLPEPTSGTGLVLDSLPDSWWSNAELAPTVVEPIVIGGRRVGLLGLARDTRKSTAKRVDRELVGELLVRLSNAVDNAQRYMRERRVARSFQTALLPTSFPTLPGRTFHASYVPATAEAEVGGDWYDAFELPDGRIAMSIGDVAGHGLEAAVIMGEVRQTFRVAAMENRDPGAVLDMANRLLMLRSEPTMVTALFGIYDGGTFTYASAGHPPPILATVEGGSESLPIAGTPLGVEASAGRSSWTVTLPTGSMLVLYTDGIIEYDRDVLDGETALLEAVRAEMSQPSGHPASGIRERVLGAKKNVDDVAILTFTVDLRPTPELDLRYTAVPVATRLVRQAVSRFACENGFSDDARFVLNVAIGEAVNNVIEHAYLRSPGTFSVRVRRENDKVECNIEDAGAWRRARREGRGRGLPIIRALTESVEVKLSQGGTILRMVYDVHGNGNDEKRYGTTGSR